MRKGAKGIDELGVGKDIMFIFSLCQKPFSNETDERDFIANRVHRHGRTFLY